MVRIISDSTSCHTHPLSGYGIIHVVSVKAKVSGSVVAGFPSPAEQYLEPPLDLNELLMKRPTTRWDELMTVR